MQCILRDNFLELVCNRLGRVYYQLPAKTRLPVIRIPTVLLRLEFRFSFLAFYSDFLQV